jgi:3-methylcrotonyl-CoA carboxylase alpha subunit
MFTKILIANRGEIACRVAATARRLGIKTVAVYSAADASSKHVAACDEAVFLGPPAASESYLVAAKIIDAAKATGAEAIHPGYGFLSENEEFALACAEAGLTFIGPPASAISAMGLKSEAKARMERAGVPLVPGYHGAEQSPQVLQQHADCIGYPVLIKASAGGGGKGMRVVEKSVDFLASLVSCQREALNAFGDDAVLIEKYLTRPRHIEVQVFADTHGQCVYLFERDCSVQRRHQKVLEEAPAPGLSASRRKAMGEAAVAAAKAVGYVGAGTVEFICEGDQFYFMEMNTRLQVEHPVTEMITGFDLVEWQLRVAALEPLPAPQHELPLRGHALEARIYAENPDKGFLPSIGDLVHLRFPSHVSFVPVGSVRVDSGVRQGDAITPHYDPMIAKLIVWGQDRSHALSLMSEALGQTQIVGLSTNVAFLKRLVDSAPFASGDVDTGLITNHHALLFPEATRPGEAVWALAVAFVLLREQETVDEDPWSSRGGFRLNQSYTRMLRWGTHETRLTYSQEGYLLNGVPFTFQHDGDNLRVMLGSLSVRGTVVLNRETLHVFTAGEETCLDMFDPLAHGGAEEGFSGKLVAPMPGKIVALVAKPGTLVSKGTALLVMEAMKMEHTITAPADGTLAEFLFGFGDQVAEGAELLRFTAS